MKNFNRIMQNLSMLVMTIAIVIQIFGNCEDMRNPPPEIEPVAAFTVDIPELENGLININTANLHQFWSIDGIGETKARAIIKYRDEHGDFASVDDLVNVSGIGEKTLERIRKYLTV